MRTPEEVARDALWAIGLGGERDDVETFADLIRARDAEVAERALTETLDGLEARLQEYVRDNRDELLRMAGFTEERTERLIPKRVPCDCPGDWQHHARLVGDDSPETHAHFDFVPSVRLVGPWEPEP